MHSNHGVRQDLAAALYVEPARLHLSGIREHEPTSDTLNGSISVDLFIAEDVLEEHASAEHIAHSLAIQAADPRSPLRQSQLTSADMLRNVSLHGPAVRVLGDDAAGETEAPGVARPALLGENHTFHPPSMTGRELRRQLLQQSRNPGSLLSTRTAVEHIKAAPHGRSRRAEGSQAEQLLIADARTSAAVWRLRERHTVF